VLGLTKTSEQGQGRRQQKVCSMTLLQLLEVLLVRVLQVPVKPTHYLALQELGPMVLLTTN
jgi:hypothetical protein